MEMVKTEEESLTGTKGREKAVTAFFVISVVLFSIIVFMVGIYIAELPFTFVALEVGTVFSCLMLIFYFWKFRDGEWVKKKK